jgi:altronate dehydratase small subunit
MTRRALIMDAGDNVATAIDDIQAGETIALEHRSRELQVLVSERIPFGHKLALAPISRGGSVIKYNEVIGTATADIAAGQLVHVHNVVSNRTNAQATPPQRARA